MQNQSVSLVFNLCEHRPEISRLEKCFQEKKSGGGHRAMLIVSSLLSGHSPEFPIAQHLKAVF